MTHPHPIRALVFDIDGTLAMMDKETGTYEPLPGAVEALELARARGVPVVAYTNGTFFPPDHYYPRLADAGLVIDPGHLLTPAVVAAGVLKARGHERVMVLADDGIRTPLAQAGIEMVEPVKTAGPVSAVMVGYTRALSSDALEAIVAAIWDGAKPFTSSVAPFVASSKGRIVGIPGAVSAAIEHCTGIAPEVMGKPSVAGMEIACGLTGVPAEASAVIGDDPKLEIRMGRAAGALTIGVTTGAYDAAAFEAVEPAHRAHLLLDTLAGIDAQPWFPAP
ncbi:HAD hydrolase-like protein [Ponticoccus sp. SC2-23]|uniref:HAD-IIA family hydrolase n=1 Tax=Alexandriicola marinus TaxID=2081710 RepID=UPI000FDA0334|nr:HAD hydrolase-like protein [Alexandriicola marinus]MBM1219204.1 HAD hydrolase-like protein [Ponticoccus sp. SC6-9]MBM1223724.1 HAD hydrolase-like protein [Ponticoccus sp. SC6-15]MBM1229017.1 HAD hydrolase-like protein [Ponticoccus sp. SC6-38]MBM1232690.1 HAD hydrolase-like protein [Ponticoccus sp. SC6-45]MBM1237360.1 HAD hydrolase-like protein [Ponticoccus sp. SC6-49]MBM1241701.1 HAD hydrolase-like protein [Ponticoccus sp. SC2-64]MBM1246214.1 HAD hydrolase-like protein [Ponticoccus sp. SC